jgi:hypothetical protein
MLLHPLEAFLNGKQKHEHVALWRSLSHVARTERERQLIDSE